MNIKSFFKKPFLLLTLGYLVTRLVNLLKLPIFNDEAIYLDWGYKTINIKGLAFYSLFDGKPPLLMWVFGIFHKIIPDPLLAGRIVSVFTGFLTLLGIYKLSQKYFGERVAKIAGMFYVVIPIFVFFDRQALMESALCAVGVWSIYYFLDLIGKPGIKNAILLGIVWGLGIFIKQSALIFVAAEIIIFAGIHLKRRDGKFNVHFLLSLFVSQAVLIPLYFQKNFWTSLSQASRFAMSFKEILAFPLDNWLANLRGIAMIPFWYFTPLIFSASVVGIFLIKDGQQRRISTYFLICITAVLIFSIVVSPRYLVAYLPLGTIFAAHAITAFELKKRIHPIALITFMALLPTVMTATLIITPLNYFESLNKLTIYSQKSEYISGWTSGYGTTQAVAFLKNISQKTPIVVGVRVDAGNPESAVFTYFNGSKKALVIYFDSRSTKQEIFKFDCISPNVPFYFVARDNSLAGMDKFLIKIAEFRNPKGDRFVGVYTLRNDCKENILNVSF